MPDVPRDPRQLARDILAGKVRIEDLARERQMRGGGAAAPGGPRMPQKIPLPRPVPPPVQRVPARPVQRPMPQQRMPIPAQRMPQPQRPMPPQPRGIPVPAQRQPQPQKPQYQYTVPPPQPAAPVVEPLSEPAVVTRAVRRPTRLSELVKSKHALRQGILLAEVLGKPVALREEG